MSSYTAGSKGLNLWQLSRITIPAHPLKHVTLQSKKQEFKSGQPSCIAKYSSPPPQACDPTNQESRFYTCDNYQVDKYSGPPPQAWDPTKQESRFYICDKYQVDEYSGPPPQAWDPTKQEARFYICDKYQVDKYSSPPPQACNPTKQERRSSGRLPAPNNFNEILQTVES